MRGGRQRGVHDLARAIGSALVFEPWALGCQGCLGGSVAVPCACAARQRSGPVHDPGMLHRPAWPRPPQEKAWNAYYAHLLVRLCSAGKGHKMTLQVGLRMGPQQQPCTHLAAPLARVPLLPAGQPPAALLPENNEN